MPKSVVTRMKMLVMRARSRLEHPDLLDLGVSYEIHDRGDVLFGIDGNEYA
jgi:hypothetical protein